MMYGLSYGYPTDPAQCPSPVDAVQGQTCPPGFTLNQINAGHFYDPDDGSARRYSCATYECQNSAGQNPELFATQQCGSKPYLTDPNVVLPVAAAGAALLFLPGFWKVLAVLPLGLGFLGNFGASVRGAMDQSGNVSCSIARSGL